MAGFCIICGSPHNEGNRYCLICIKDIATEGKKEVWVDVEPPPHKDDF